MKITIKPEEGEKFEKIVHEKVYELIVAGNKVTRELPLQVSNISHTWGDIYELFGKLESTKERLRRFHDDNTK